MEKVYTIRCKYYEEYVDLITYKNEEVLKTERVTIKDFDPVIHIDEPEEYLNYEH